MVRCDNIRRTEGWAMVIYKTTWHMVYHMPSYVIMSWYNK